MNTIEQMRNEAIKRLLSINVQFHIEDLGNCIHFEPDTRCAIKAGLKAGSFDGKQIIYWKNDNSFEYSEYQAGVKQNELHIFGNFKTFKSALTCLLSGVNKKPILIY